jgi:hypothetical protein
MSLKSGCGFSDIGNTPSLCLRSVETKMFYGDLGSIFASTDLIEI